MERLVISISLIVSFTLLILAMITAGKDGGIIEFITPNKPIKTILDNRTINSESEQQVIETYPATSVSGRRVMPDAPPYITNS